LFLGRGSVGDLRGIIPFGRLLAASFLVKFKLLLGNFLFVGVGVKFVLFHGILGPELKHRSAFMH
jgi:hypothetical protein